MRKRIIILFMMALLFIPSLSSAYVPFAPVADIPENPGTDPEVNEAIALLQKAKILEQDEVGLPPYLDAKVVHTTGSQDEALPMVMLISSDKVLQVVEFYRLNLRGWDYRKVDGSHVFQQDKSEGSLKDKIPTIQIGESELFKKVFPTTKTEIRIWYNP